MCLFVILTSGVGLAIGVDDRKTCRANLLIYALDGTFFRKSDGPDAHEEKIRNLECHGSSSE